MPDRRTPSSEVARAILEVYIPSRAATCLTIWPLISKFETPLFTRHDFVFCGAVGRCHPCRAFVGPRLEGTSSQTCAEATTWARAIDPNAINGGRGRWRGRTGRTRKAISPLRSRSSIVPLLPSSPRAIGSSRQPGTRTLCAPSWPPAPRWRPGARRGRPYGGSNRRMGFVGRGGRSPRSRSRPIAVRRATLSIALGGCSRTHRYSKCSHTLRKRWLLPPQTAHIRRAQNRRDDGGELTCEDLAGTSDRDLAFGVDHHTLRGSAAAASGADHG